MTPRPQNIYFERIWPMFPQLKDISWPKPKPKLMDLYNEPEDEDGHFMVSFQSDPVTESDDDDKGEDEEDVDRDEAREAREDDEDAAEENE